MTDIETLLDKAERLIRRLGRLSELKGTMVTNEATDERIKELGWKGKSGIHADRDITSFIRYIWHD